MIHHTAILFTSNSNLLVKEFYATYNVAKTKIDRIFSSSDIHSHLAALYNTEGDLNDVDVMTIDIDLIKPTSESQAAQCLKKFKDQTCFVFRELYNLYALCSRILHLRKSLNALKWTQSTPSEYVFTQIGKILEDRYLDPAMRADLEFLLEFVFELDPETSKASPESIQYFIRLTTQIINAIEISLVPAHVLFQKKLILESFLNSEQIQLVPFVESLRLGQAPISIYQARISPVETVVTTPLSRSRTVGNLTDIMSIEEDYSTPQNPFPTL